MLEIVIPSRSWINEATNEFVISEERKLQLEHSLISVAKWEAKWKRSFMDSHTKGLSVEEYRDYIRCMTITRGVDPMVYFALTPNNFEEIQKYIGDPHTATTIRDSHHKGKRSSKVVTAELVYYWMFSNNIPLECEKWHFGRLMTLIQVCFIESNGSKPMSQREIMKQNSALNAMRKAKHHTKG